MHCRLVLLGPPAAGKGTQADLLRKRYGFDAPSVGAMLREQKAQGTPAGLEAATFFERGLLVPDEITIEVVRQWVTGQDGSWALDGFPRTVRQAEAFDAMLNEEGEQVDVAIFIAADEETIKDRVLHRVVCAGCGAIYRVGVHVAAASDPCPACGQALERRKDDNLEALADRLSEYRSKTEPVNAFYEAKEKLRRVEGNQPVEKVFAQICGILEPTLARRSE